MKPFVSTDSSISTGQVWEEWLEELEQDFRYFKTEKAADKIEAMIIYEGKKLARLEKSLPDPGQPEGEDNQMDDYEKLKTKANGYYLCSLEDENITWRVIRSQIGSESQRVRL